MRVKAFAFTLVVLFALVGSYVAYALPESFGIAKGWPLGSGLPSGFVPPINPGSPGFLATCSGNFQFANALTHSQSFTTGWTATGSGAAAPTVTDNFTTAPDSTTTASRLVLPATSVGQVSAIYQPVTNYVPGLPRTFDLYVKGAAGGETIQILTNGGALPNVDTKITATTSWARYTLQYNQTTGPIYYEIGIDSRAPTDQGATSAQTVYIWGAQDQDLQYSLYTKLNSPYVATTTAAANSPVYNLPCPPNTAFRDFSTLAANPSNPVINQNTAPTNGGGVNSLYAGNSLTLPSNSSTYFAMSEWRNSSGAYDWNGFGEYTSPDFKNWTLTSTTPVITRSLNTWKDHYMLRPNITTTCSLGAFCAYYSGVNSAGSSQGGSSQWSIGVSYSNDGLTWTDYASNPVINNLTSPGLPFPLLIGSNLNLYTVIGGNNGQGIYRWLASPSNTTSFALNGFALRAATASDWDTGNGGIIDPDVWYNTHGFYEMTYTAEISGTQKIGYAISTDGIIWYRRSDAPIITASSLEHLSGYLNGDFQTVENNGVFNMLYTWDNGTNLSAGYLATMHDY